MIIVITDHALERYLQHKHTHKQAFHFSNQPRKEIIAMFKRSKKIIPKDIYIPKGGVRDIDYLERELYKYGKWYFCVKKYLHDKKIFIITIMYDLRLTCSKKRKGKKKKY